MCTEILICTCTTHADNMCVQILIHTCTIHVDNICVQRYQYIHVPYMLTTYMCTAVDYTLRQCIEHFTVVLVFGGSWSSGSDCSVLVNLNHVYVSWILRFTPESNNKLDWGSRVEQEEQTKTLRYSVYCVQLIWTNNEAQKTISYHNWLNSGTSFLAIFQYFLQDWSYCTVSNTWTN